MIRNQPNQSLNEKEAASFLGLSRQSLANWRCQRRGPVYHKIGGRIIYRAEDLEQFLHANRIDPSR